MSKKILVLDPDKNFRKLIAPVFESRGHEVIQEENSESSLETLKNGEIDLILVGSPLNGISAEGWLNKAREIQGSTPIVFIAGDKTELAEMKPRLGKYNLDLVSNKPLIPFIFGARIECVLEGGDSEAQQTKLKNFETMFMALVSKYARVLPDKLSELAQAIEAAKASPENLELLDEVKAIAHKTKGTGGSLGFKKVGEHMAFIEDSTIAMKEMTVEERNHIWHQIDRRLIDAQMDGDQEAKEVIEVVQAKEQDEEAEPESSQETPAMARIMVVDKDTDFLQVVEQLGKETSVEVVSAENPEEAIAKAKQLPLDAALINIVSESSAEGLQLAREIRSLPGYDNLPLAFISGENEVDDQAAATHVGASLHLKKPFKQDSLEKAVEHLVAIRQGGRPRILVTDDDEFFANTIALVLRNEGMIVKTLNDPTNILDTMQEFPPDMLLLDVMMPGITGFDVCRKLRKVPRWRDLPIIFLTGQTGVEARVEAFRCGGDDYLPKPVVNEELLTRVKVRIDRAAMLRERSDKDTITGLLLRRAFSEQLSAILAESERINTNFSICLLDVDKFKLVNDTHGHLAGDRVLAGLGQLLARRFRVDDIRGRWGGEEFILAFKREKKETIHKAVNRVLDEFRGLEFESDNGTKFHCSFSGGLATYPDDGESIFDLVQAADKRLYIAKESGRNQIIYSDTKKEEIAANK